MWLGSRVLPIRKFNLYRLYVSTWFNYAIPLFSYCASISFSFVFPSDSLSLCLSGSANSFARTLAANIQFSYLGRIVMIFFCIPFSGGRTYEWSLFTSQQYQQWNQIKGDEEENEQQHMNTSSQNDCVCVCVMHFDKKKTMKHTQNNDIYHIYAHFLDTFFCGSSKMGSLCIVE